MRTAVHPAGPKSHCEGIPSVAQVCWGQGQNHLCLRATPPVLGMGGCWMYMLHIQ